MKSLCIRVKLVLCLFGLLIFKVSVAKNYIDYNKKIIEARLLACQGEYEKSARLYAETFNHFDFEFARDCYNAVEVTLNTDEDSISSYLICCALRRGILLCQLDSIKRIDRIKKTHYWQDIEKNAEEYYNAYLASIDQELKKEMRMMFAEDQLIRKKYYAWYNFPFKPIIHAKWKKLNHQQVEKIITITAEKGFPGERMIGIDTKADHYKLNDDEYSAGMNIIILIHHYSQPNVSFDSLLKVQVELGNLMVEHFVTICDFEAQYGKGKYPGEGAYGFRFRPEGNNPAIYDEKRAAIGMMKESELKVLRKCKAFTRFWFRLT